MTPESLYTQILENVESGITEVTNFSNTGIAVNLAQAFANSGYAIYSEILNTKYEISNNLNTGRAYQQQDYINNALAFQYGYNLTQPNVPLPNGSFEPYYETIDENAKIIKQVSVNSVYDSDFVDSAGNQYFGNGRVNMNVATTDTNGYLIPLTSVQLSSFISYMTKNYGEMGMPLNIYSNSGNLLRFGSIQIEYFSNYSLSYVMDSVKKQVQNSILSSLYGGLSLKGSTFVVNLLEYYVTTKINQSASGESLQSVNFWNGQMNTPTKPTVWENFTNSVFLTSGYFNYDASLMDMLSDHNNYKRINK